MTSTWGIDQKMDKQLTKLLQTLSFTFVKGIGWCGEEQQEGVLKKAKRVGFGSR
jgi:hypothetical protein